MGEKATLRMARQELEDLYLGVPDNSVDLTFRDLLPLPPAGAAAAHVDDDERNSKALLRSSTNIFTYRIESPGDDGRAAGLELPPSPAVAGLEAKKKQQQDPATGHVGSCRGANYKRPGIAHSDMCALCSKYVYLFRHRCLVCGRVYCRRCVGEGMGDMTEGRKCIDCLGRRYSHRYIHRAGAGALCCCLWVWGYPNAASVKAQELVWAEKGPAPRRRPGRPPSSSSCTSTSISYGASMTSTHNNSMLMTINAPPAPAPAPASSSSSFVASFSPNPHAFPL